MPIIHCKFSSGQRVPFIVSKSKDRASLPLLIPLLYVQFKLKYRAYNTASRCLRTIEAFYDYALLRNIDLEKEIFAGRFENVLSLISGFSAWLTVGRQATNVVAAVGVETSVPMNSRTRDQHLSALKAFLSWCAERFIPRPQSTRESGISIAFSNAALAIDRRFSSHILNLKQSRSRERSLTDEHIQLIRTYATPYAELNPFPERVQLRNWLIIELFLETGMRRGELLKLYSSDINQGSLNAYVSISNRENDPEDIRADEPALKTYERVIGISNQLYEIYEEYLREWRRPFRKGIRKKVPFQYLFISDRGRPLSLRALSNIFDLLFYCIDKDCPGVISSLSPHDLRHTFATNFLKYLIEECDLDMEQAKDQLKRICGWSANSSMPSLYASRYVAESANIFNSKRVCLTRNK
ncbi:MULTISPECIES: tyrosine-type recombinase/integrase [Deefgea]|uniref:Tyrosine-type recombinase/integrase n=1 Tax=Deefgea chitinilytica TaxID=570276 RepID=A0ABS2C9B3_9NEIS|nr:MULTISPECIES: site-specific integrase [Deefgea]MBM5570744.1 tyrosine-type recombinase/integrase [Deefgea chitinilytica]MBM9887973.1 site-specific integrase [Deefgea sp. CFH1-16]